MLLVSDAYLLSSIGSVTEKSAFDNVRRAVKRVGNACYVNQRAIERLFDAICWGTIFNRPQHMNDKIVLRNLSESKIFTFGISIDNYML